MNELDTLRQEKGLTIRQIVRGTGLSYNTVRAALGRLKQLRSRPKRRSLSVIYQFITNHQSTNKLKKSYTHDELVDVLFLILSDTISVKEAQDKIGISKSYLSRILNGERKQYAFYQAKIRAEIKREKTDAI